MADRPQSGFPFIDRNLTNIDPNYLANALQLVGFQPDQVIPSRVHNTLWLLGALWQTYLDYGTVRTDDNVDAATSQRWSADKLEYNVGDNVTIGGASLASMPVYYFDGYRVDLDESLLRPARADPLLVPEVPKPGRIWVYLTTALISDPQQPTATARVEAVAEGVADSPQAGELTLRGVDVDAAGLITANVDAITQPEPDFALVFNTLLQRWLGETEHLAQARFTDPAGFAVIADGQVSIDTAASFAGLTALIATSDGAPATVEADNVSGRAILATSLANTTGTIEGENTGAGASVRGIKNVGGVAVQGDASAGGGTGVQGVGGLVGVEGTASTGVGVQGLTDGGVGVRGESTGIGAAVIGLGGPSPVSRAGVFIAGDPDATSVLVQSAAGASSSGIALYGQGQGAATGVQAFSSDGYGLFARSDPTSPTRAAIHIEPQDDDPTTPLQGDFLFNSARGPAGALRVRRAVWESVHASPKGYAVDKGLAVSGSVLSGNQADLSTIQIQAEEVGVIELHATGSLDWSTDLGVTTIQIVDITGGLPGIVINGGGVGIDEYPIVGATARDHSFVARVPYTVPDTATRTYVVRLSAGGATTIYKDVYLTGEGTY